jgi:hypothetical protein
VLAAAGLKAGEVLELDHNVIRAWSAKGILIASPGMPVNLT